MSVSQFEGQNLSPQEQKLLSLLTPEELLDIGRVKSLLKMAREKVVIDAAMKEVEEEAQAAAEEARQKVMERARKEANDRVRKKSRQKEHVHSVWIAGEKSRLKDNINNSVSAAEKAATLAAEKAAKNARERIYEAAKVQALQKFYSTKA